MHCVARLVQVHRPVILPATHGARVHADCLFLRDRGYRLESLTVEPKEISAEILARPK
jgi:hypothetical protein